MEKLGLKIESESSVFNRIQKEVLRERAQELVRLVVKGEYPCLIFLDNSARPLAWMFQEAWKKYVPERKQPAIRFVNIGREKGDVINWESMGPYKGDYNTNEEYENATKEFWSKLDSSEYLKKLKLSLEEIFSESKNRSILLVDDYISSGFSIELARGFFRHNFPDIGIDSHSFLEREDENVFSKERWNGTYLPWNGDKAYALLKEDTEHPERVISQPERDPVERQKGLELKEEIKDIFINEKPIRLDNSR